MLGHWRLIEADLHERYGIDAELCMDRSWRWLQTRILALFDVPPLIAPDGTTLPATRLGLALRPPDTDRR